MQIDPKNQVVAQCFASPDEGSRAVYCTTLHRARTPDHPLVQSIYKNIIYLFNYKITITRTQVIHEVNTPGQNTQDQHYLRHFQCVKILKLSENQKKAWMANTSRVCFVYSNIWSKCHLFSVKKGHNHPFPHDLHVLLCH